MKKLIIVIFILNMGLIKAQTYHPFPDSNAVWRVNWSSSGCLLSGIPGARYQYFLSGDTIINTIPYKKISCEGVDTYCCFPPHSPNNGYIGAFRQEILNKKVFIVLANDTVESLLYDFNMAVGDTIKGILASPSNIIINSIDSIQIGLWFHKKFNFNYISGFNSLIEGIGSTQGLIEPIFTFDAAGALICFERNDSTLYFNTSTFDSCSIITYTQEISTTNLIQIFPNPASRSSTIEFESKTDCIRELEFYDILGKKVKTVQKINRKKFQLQENDFKSGLYIYKVELTDEKYIYGKLIIE